MAWPTCSLTWLAMEAARRASTLRATASSETTPVVLCCRWPVLFCLLPAAVGSALGPAGTSSRGQHCQVVGSSHLGGSRPAASAAGFAWRDSCSRSFCSMIKTSPCLVDTTVVGGEVVAWTRHQTPASR